MDSTAAVFVSPRASDATRPLPHQGTDGTKPPTPHNNAASTDTMSDKLKAYTSGSSVTSSGSSELEFAHNADTSDLASSPVRERGDSSDVGVLPVLVRDIEAVRLKTPELSAPVGELPTVEVEAPSEDSQVEGVVEDVAAAGDAPTPSGSPSSAGKTSTSPDSGADGTSKGDEPVEPDVVEIVCNLVDDVGNSVDDGDVIVVSPERANGHLVSSICDTNGASPPKRAKASLVPYRVRQEDACTSDSESSSSSSDDDVVVIVRNRGPRCNSDVSDEDGAPTAKKPERSGKPAHNRGIKVPGELDIDDLPPIEDLHITLPRTELRPAGRVRHAVDRLLVVESEPGQPVLDLDSVLFRADGTALGRVFDVLGPVAAPYYTVRFNSADELSGEHGLKPGDVVLYAPLHADVTQYVLESEVRKQRGSDASWENNVEPPPEHLDFSDDEQEREARKQLRNARAGGASGDQSAEGGQRGSRGRGRGGGPSRGGGRGRQQPAKVPGPANGSAGPRFEGPPRPGQFQGTRAAQWPPNQGPPPPHWQRSPATPRFRPNVPPPPCPSPMFGVPPYMPPVWNTPPPPMNGPPWRPWGNGPPAFPNLRTPPPNFQPQAAMLAPPGTTFPGGQQLHTPPGVSSPGGQHGSGMRLPGSLLSPVYNSSGQQVPMYDPVPDLNRILTSPPPAPML